MRKIIEFWLLTKRMSKKKYLNLKLTAVSQAVSAYFARRIDGAVNVLFPILIKLLDLLEIKEGITAITILNLT